MMNSKTFKCTFLSDVVLNADTATEGNRQSLDYIPGTCFLGIVAKNYENVSNSYDIFHSGKVRFGDAHISKNGKRSLKQPASWFYQKDDDKKEEIFLHHYIIGDMREDFIKKDIQLKQIRTGYFIDGEIVSANHNFSIKSAHCLEERRSAEGKLYGYDTLVKGSEWIFSVESDNEDLLKEVKEALLGEHNIGRSKTAQYGRVKIEQIKSPLIEQINADIIIENKNYIILYFESCAAFIDSAGNPSFHPDIETLGLKNGIVKWEKSQIRTRTFAPWNAKRKTRDADRICIDKGSVIVVEDGEIDKNRINSGIGVYQNEGFGKIIVNPDFLLAGTDVKLNNPPQFSKPVKTQEITAVVSDAIEDKLITDWITEQTIKQKRYSMIVEATNKFIKEHKSKFKKISSSQWGAVRERSQRFADYDRLEIELFRPEKSHKDNRGINIIVDKGGFLMHGKSEQKWRNCYSTLQKELETVRKDASGDIARHFLINLCSEMAKMNKSTEKGRNK